MDKSLTLSLDQIVIEEAKIMLKQIAMNRSKAL